MKISVLIKRGDCLKIRKQATCGIDYNPGVSFYSLFTKWFVILAADYLHFCVTKFAHVAVYWRLGCVVWDVALCVLSQTVDSVLAGSNCLLFPFPRS